MLFCFVVFSTPLLELVKDKFSLVLREGRGDAVEAAAIAPYYVEHVPRELTWITAPTEKANATAVKLILLLPVNECLKKWS